MVAMFLVAINAKRLFLNGLPSMTRDASFELACIACSSVYGVMAASLLTSIAIPAGCTPKASFTSYPYFA